MHSKKIIKFKISTEISSDICWTKLDTDQDVKKRVSSNCFIFYAAFFLRIYVNIVLHLMYTNSCV